MLNTYPKDITYVKLKLAGHVVHAKSNSVAAQLFWLTFTFLLIYILSDNIYLYFITGLPVHLGLLG